MANVVSQLMIKLLADFGAAGKAKSEVEALDKSLGHLGKTSGNTDKVAKSIKDVGEAAKGLASAGWSKGFLADIDRLGVGADKIANLKREYQDLLNTLRGQRASVALPKLDAWEKSTIASLKRVKQEVAGSGSGSSLPGIFGIGRRFLGPLAAGYGAYHLGKEAIGASAGLDRENYRGSLSGMTPEELAESSKTAGLLTQKYRNVSQQEIMEHTRKLRGTLGDFHHAQDMIESVIQAQSVLSSGPGGKEGAIRDLDQITKGLEGAGFANEPAKFGRMLNAFVKAKNLFGETVSGEDFRTYIQRSKSSKFGLSEDYLAGVVPTMIQHEGANQFGTAQATAFNALIGGRQTKDSKAKLKAFGLLGDDGDVIDKGLLISDPDKWASKNLKSRMEAAGMKLNTEAGSAERKKAVEFLMKAFSARNTGEFFASLLANEGVINKDRANLKNATGIEGAAGNVARDPYQGWEAIKTQSANLAANLLENGGKISAALSAVATAIGWAADMVKGDYKDRVSKDDRALFDARGIAGPEGIMGGLPPTEEEQRKADEAARRKLDGTPNDFKFSDMAPAADAAAAGASSGSGFRQGLKSELEQAEQDVAASVGRMKGMLNFTASPNITPNVTAPSGGGGVPGKQSSLRDTSRRLARLIDDHDTGNFADREYG